MANHVGAIDQGTTSTRFMIFDHDGHEVARHELRHEQITPEEGWVEHDPHELWEATQDVIEAALGRAGIGADGLAAIGVTNQRETTVVWDRRTGEPYCHAIARHDVRIGTAGSGGGLGWILQHVDGVRADADAGHAIFGTIDSWLIWWLTGGPDGGRHMTDVTNAGRTALMDLGTLAWDDELLAVLGIPRSMLPEIRSSSEVYGRTDADGPFKGEVDVAAALGDQHAALVGQVCFRPGELAGTDGTDHAVIVNTGTEIVRSTHGLLTTPAYRFGDAPPVYALVGSTDGEALEDVVAAMIADSGTDLQILRDGGALAADEALMQRRADVLGVPVSRPVVAETTALGAAYAAGLAVGFWGSTDELIASWHESRRWEPASTRESLG